MKTKLPSITILGGVLFLFFGVFGGLSFWELAIAFSALEAILCSFIAAKKNKNTNAAFFAGFFLGPFAILYYLVCSPGMSEKEKELHDWEVEKKYQIMKEERSRQ